VPDHFGTPYCMTPNPLQTLTYFAARSERLTFGTMVLVLPWYHPIQLAHQIAYLDIASKGRFTTIGMGRGVALSEYEALGISRDDSRDRFAECVDILELALTTERFSYDGKHFKIPETSLRPQPVTKDLPSRFYGASATNSSLEYLARRGIKPMGVGNKPIADLAKDVQLFNKFRAEEGMEPARPRTVLYMCCSTDKEKIEEANGYAVIANQAVSLHYGFDDPASFKGVKGYEAYAAFEATGHGEDDRAYNRSAMLIGTPDEILEKVLAAHEMCGFDEIALHSAHGGMPYEDAKASMTLFAEEVLPVLHKLEPAPFKVAESAMAK
jgi:alkanesulfonate monooxygenase SsuD/methylene tetrahydromethanopterin reductase-like flavin-dependent oxidoreductase (luciferase family)